MNLIPDQVLNQIPALYSLQNKGNVFAENITCKLYTSNMTWYVLEFDGKDVLYCYIQGKYPGFKYFSLKKLNSMVDETGEGGVKLDHRFKPASLSNLLS